MLPHSPVTLRANLYRPVLKPLRPVPLLVTKALTTHLQTTRSKSLTSTHLVVTKTLTSYLQATKTLTTHLQATRSKSLLVTKTFTSHLATMSAPASPAAKRLKTTDAAAPLIGTHSGHFHADEALAVYMLRLLPTYAESPLVRTRDPAKLAECHTVVDVGGEYDPARRRFDHHQRGFTATFPGRKTKLSSAGLVWAEFGREIVAQELRKARAEESRGGGSAEAMDITGDDGNTSTSVDVDDAAVTLVWKRLYESLIEALDGHDNGISALTFAPDQPPPQRNFSEAGFTLGALVGAFNPSWNTPVPSDPAEAQAAEDARFLEASAAIGGHFSRELSYTVRSWLPAREVVAAAFAARKGPQRAAETGSETAVDERGRILVLARQAVPWKDHLYTLESEAEAAGATDDKVLYVVYPEKPVPGAAWRVQAVPVEKDSFESRRPLLEPWRGFRDEQLSEICGVPGAIFVHASGFIGGNKTFDGAIAMAKKALDM